MYYSKDSGSNFYYEAVIPNNVGAQLAYTELILAATTNLVFKLLQANVLLQLIPARSSTPNVFWNFKQHE